MRLVFTKCKGRHDRLDVFDADYLVESVACPRDGAIPQDMLLYAIASTLHLRGRSDLPQPEYWPLSERMPDGPGCDTVAPLAELFQIGEWTTHVPNTAQEMLQRYRMTCAAWMCDPLPLDTEDLTALHARLLALYLQWRAVSADQSLILPLC